MVEALMKINKCIEEIKDVTDSITHGVVNGHNCPTCGNVCGDDVVHVKLEVPRMCPDCFFGSACTISACGNSNCESLWKKIIDHHKNK